MISLRTLAKLLGAGLCPSSSSESLSTNFDGIVNGNREASATTQQRPNGQKTGPTTILGGKLNPAIGPDRKNFQEPDATCPICLIREGPPSDHVST